MIMMTKIKEVSEKFFTWMKTEFTSLEVRCENEEKNIFFLTLQTPDSKLIIGTHWQTLDSIRHILTRMLDNILWVNIILHIEVNNYLQSKDDRLYRYIDWRIDFVIKTWREIVLSNFSAYERKKIHTYISSKNLTNISSYSVWEWKDRVMHLCPKSTNKKWPSIDIEGTWI